MSKDSNKSRKPTISSEMTNHENSTILSSLPISLAVSRATRLPVQFTILAATIMVENPNTECIVSWKPFYVLATFSSWRSVSAVIWQYRHFSQPSLSTQMEPMIKSKLGWILKQSNGKHQLLGILFIKRCSQLFNLCTGHKSKLDEIEWSTWWTEHRKDFISTKLTKTCK